jgi:Spy/CpxP family protein refolding chaperone
MAHRVIIIAVAVWLSTVAGAYGQGPGGPPGPGSPDPLSQALIPPDVVMSHQQALDLTDAQTKVIESDVQAAQQRFTRVQWQLAAATEKLVELLKQPHVDQSKALAQLDAVLNLEREMKHTQLMLMIQVKNELTTDQQVKVRQFIAGGPK